MDYHGFLAEHRTHDWAFKVECKVGQCAIGNCQQRAYCFIPSRVPGWPFQCALSVQEASPGALSHPATQCILSSIKILYLPLQSSSGDYSVVIQG